MFASDSVFLPRLNTRGVCPTNQRQSVECSKLGKTRIIKDANIWLVKNATFFD